MKRKAFVMQLKPGFEEEYQQRHAEIWPELVEELKRAGIVDYSIHLHPETLQLFGVFSFTESQGLDALPDKEIMKKWWAYMADIMDTNADNSPISAPLSEVFYMP
jgi:L-rhamnose mutarotase